MTATTTDAVCAEAARFLWTTVPTVAKMVVDHNFATFGQDAYPPIDPPLTKQQWCYNIICKQHVLSLLITTGYRHCPRATNSKSDGGAIVAHCSPKDLFKEVLALTKMNVNDLPPGTSPKGVRVLPSPQKQLVAHSPNCYADDDDCTLDDSSDFIFPY